VSLLNLFVGAEEGASFLFVLDGEAMCAFPICLIQNTKGEIFLKYPPSHTPTYTLY